MLCNGVWFWEAKGFGRIISVVSTAFFQCETTTIIVTTTTQELGTEQIFYNAFCKTHPVKACVKYLILTNSILPVRYCSFLNFRDLRKLSHYQFNRFAQWYTVSRACHVVLVVKNPPANPGDIRDAGSVLGLERFPGGGHDNPLQYSCLENPRDRSLVGCHLWGYTELDMIDMTEQQQQQVS